MLGKAAVPNIADDDTRGVKHMPQSRADIDGVGWWQIVGLVKVLLDNSDRERAIGGLTAAIGGRAGNGCYPDREAGA